MLRYFWDAVVELDNRAAAFDEGIRFAICKEGELENLVRNAGLKQVEAAAVEERTIFKDFDDYWKPFISNVGPAPGYNMSLSPNDRQHLEDNLREPLPVESGCSIRLTARAWAVKGRVQIRPKLQSAQT